MITTETVNLKNSSLRLRLVNFHHPRVAMMLNRGDHRNVHPCIPELSMTKGDVEEEQQPIATVSSTISSNKVTTSLERKSAYSEHQLQRLTVSLLWFILARRVYVVYR